MLRGGGGGFHYQRTGTPLDAPRTNSPFSAAPRDYSDFGEMKGAFQLMMCVDVIHRKCCPRNNGQYAMACNYCCVMIGDGN